MICTTCQTCLQQSVADQTVAPNGWRGGQAHHPTNSSFKQSIADGCYVCTTIWANPERSRSPGSIPVAASVDSGDEVSDTASGTISSAPCTEYTVALCRGSNAQTRRFQFTYLPPPSLTAGAPSKTTKIKKGNCFLLQPVSDAEREPDTHLIDPSTGSARTLALAKHWVSECTEKHGQCKILAEDRGWYPTRLLELSDSGQSVRLIQTKETAPTGRYMTLTHRWGPVDVMKLTKATFPGLAKGVQISSLPQLFQDSIHVTRELGIRYLWIDSLCILQDRDDLSDWRHESLRMETVYSNSYCNISAASAADPTESLFNTRTSESIQPPIVELKPPNPSGNGPDMAKPFMFYDQYFWDKEVSKAPVNTRAWAVQERLLAPRVLHFGKRQLAWECFDKDAAEIYPAGLPQHLTKLPGARFKCLDPNVFHELKTRVGITDAGETPTAYLLWSRLVDVYSECALTFPKDKLIACAGLAKRMAPILQDEYIAGMWRRYLEGELLWIVPGAQVPGSSSRPKEYRAPTWSWASVDGLIRAGAPTVEHAMIKVEDYHLTYPVDDKMSDISGGWLRLRGVLREMKLSRTSAPAGAPNYHQWDMTLDGVKVTTVPDTKTGYVQPQVFLDVFSEDFERENTEGLFAMCARSPKGDGDLTTGASMYILLFRVVDRATGTFERIGIARESGQEGKARIMALRRDSQAPQLPCIEYRDGLHSIRVI
ncbi:heterokaryon incompatibility protein-domain-containing protein [Cercophora scortea]|uniref:Heterokaryon incompatibility protein-domain-containing protein n=1 Tax=Cercophora scortea TaxID=314031 RepID=A0AAE0IXM6_9PEZI|nr:heterokaryon incompatibility protein-domain-containing protein [Cercophora scortea]